MKNSCLFFTGFCLLALPVYSQQRGWNWYFGNHAGLTFKTGSPQALANGQLNTIEGCASISDTSGNLLFYTDGLTVYNRNHAAMVNGTGLLGNPSSTQSAIIVKQPESDSLFYIFTVDAGENAIGSGFNYSIVDMSQDRSRGKVIFKNKLVRAQAREKLAAARCGNGSDYWILINDFIEDDIFAYRLTSTGLDTTIIRSHVGPIHNGVSVNTVGYMKVSRQDNRIAFAVHRKTGFWVFDFNNNTGIATNKIVINSTNTDSQDVYGVEFSPNGKLLYGSILKPPTGVDSKIFQYDLQAGSATAIVSSEIVVATHTPLSGNYHYYGALQLGPDGIIYSAHSVDTFVGAITNPNQQGLACNYINNAIRLSGKKSTNGLPNMLAAESGPALEKVYYRSRQTGNWNNTNTWETSPDSTFSSGITSPAIVTPNRNNSFEVTVRLGHKVAVTENVISAKVIVNYKGEVHVGSGIHLKIVP